MAKLLIVFTYCVFLAIVAMGILSGHDIATIVKLRATNLEYQKEIQGVIQSSFRDRLSIAVTMAARTWIPGLDDAARGGPIDKFTTTILCERADNPFSYVLGRGDVIDFSDLNDAAGNIFNCTGR
jgi:hypothetical protein